LGKEEGREGPIITHTHTHTHTHGKHPNAPSLWRHAYKSSPWMSETTNIFGDWRSHSFSSYSSLAPSNPGAWRKLFARSRAARCISSSLPVMGSRSTLPTMLGRKRNFEPSTSASPAASPARPRHNKPSLIPRAESSLLFTSSTLPSDGIRIPTVFRMFFVFSSHETQRCSQGPHLPIYRPTSLHTAATMESFYLYLLLLFLGAALFFLSYFPSKAPDSGSPAQLSAEELRRRRVAYADARPQGPPSCDPATDPQHVQAQQGLPPVPTQPASSSYYSFEQARSAAAAREPAAAQPQQVQAQQGLPPVPTQPAPSSYYSFDDKLQQARSAAAAREPATAAQPQQRQQDSPSARPQSQPAPPAAEGGQPTWEEVSQFAASEFKCGTLPEFVSQRTKELRRRQLEEKMKGGRGDYGMQ